MARIIHLLLLSVHMLVCSGALVSENKHVTAEDIKSWKVTMTPRVQKVAEGSKVVFTCKSSLSANVRFHWGKPKKQIQPKDDVTIVQIADNLSVLHIESAHLKRHRRTYRCTAYYEDPDTGSVSDLTAEGSLKVIANRKLPKTFPIVTSRVYEELLESRPGYIPLVCDIEGSWSKSFPLYTWYKDSLIDLSLEQQNWENDGMRILYLEPFQANGSFQCAAFYKKGAVASYGTVIPRTFIADYIQSTECTSFNGSIVKEGNLYQPRSDPCETCTCQNGQPDYCMMVACMPPEDCKNPQPKPGVCCEFDCDRPVGLEERGSNTSSCVDRKGISVEEGDLFRPGPDPCNTCMCSAGEPVLCAQDFCDAPPCRNYITIPDTCCGFECFDCMAHNGSWVEEGSPYNPSVDPCETCVCSKGNPAYCFNVACMKPIMPCPDPMAIPGECCKFTCDISLSGNETALRRKECTSFNGSFVKEGDLYQPRSDPCETCTCQNGQPDYCMMVACMPPEDCKNLQPKPGVCCEFHCDRPVGLKERECMANNGSHVNEGKMYQPDSDPCKLCTCMKGEPMYCLTSRCFKPVMPCPNPRPVPGVCCKFTCEEGRNISVLSNGECMAYNGSHIKEGKMYQPDRDTCKLCSCMKGEPRNCLTSRCFKPVMPCPNPRPVPGVCCKFTCEEGRNISVLSNGECMAYNGSHIKEGKMYQPDRDACKLCTCMKGDPRYCLTSRCFKPVMPCPNPRPVPGVCCKFTCEEGRNISVLSNDGCKSYNGTMVPYGASYQPSSDPCESCMCSERDEICMMVSCAMPPMPCPNPSRVPNECCSYTCNVTANRPAFDNYTRGCKSYNGTMVPYGSSYQPSSDPCKSCICSERDEICMMVSCAMPPMPCPNPSRVPNECCSFSCNVTATIPPMTNYSRGGYHRIHIQPIVQQVGPRSAMVQWNNPDRQRFSEYIDLQVVVQGRNYYGQFTPDHGMNSVIIRDLNNSARYDVSVTAFAKLYDPSDDKYLHETGSRDFMLEPKATSSLNLQHAIGDVFTAQGGDRHGFHNHPLNFERLRMDEDSHIILNLNTFHFMEISYYDEMPCKDECGMMGFYMYNMTGHPHNIMSLMFMDYMDFNWAKAHL